MKKALVVLLIMVVLVTGLPVLMGMAGMAGCHDCGPAVAAAAGCALAVLAAGLVVALAMLSERVRRRRQLMLSSASRFLLERPPQLA